MSIERVLIVDHNAEHTAFMRDCCLELQFSDKNIRIAQDAEEALKVAKEFHPHLVCVSWDITPVPGTIFVQRLRSDRKHAYTPFLIYSERLSDDDIFLARELGLDNIVRMPFHKEDVVDLFKTIIEREQKIAPVEKKLRKIESFMERDRLTDALGLIDPSLTKPGKHAVRSHTVLGKLWYQLKKLDKAEAMVSAALKEDSSYAQALQIMARIRSAQGRHDEAIEILQEMAELAPGNLSTKLSLGATFVEADRIDEAKETLQEISILDPDCEEVKGELGKVAYKEGDVDLAKQLMSQTGQGNQMATFFNDIAIAMVNKGDFEKGLKTYQDAVNILSDSSKLHFLLYNMGLAYRKKGDMEEAFRAFCDCYIENPAYEKAYKALAAVAKKLKEKGVSLNPDLVKGVNTARKEYKNKQTQAA